MENSNFEILLASVIGLLIWAAILYAIIKNATKSDAIKKELEIQTRLLMKIAEKGGISGGDIRACLKPMPLPE